MKKRIVKLARDNVTMPFGISHPWERSLASTGRQPKYTSHRIWSYIYDQVASITSGCTFAYDSKSIFFSQLHPLHSQKAYRFILADTNRVRSKPKKHGLSSPYLSSMCPRLPSEGI